MGCVKGCAWAWAVIVVCAAQCYCAAIPVRRGGCDMTMGWRAIFWRTMSCLILILQPDCRLGHGRRV